MPRKSRPGLRRELERGLRFLAGVPANSPLQLPSIRDPERLLDVLVPIVPPLKATALTATSLLNLWLAALIVRVSGRLKRPWPQIAQMSFPPFAATVLAIAVAGTFLPDLIGLVEQHIHRNACCSPMRCSALRSSTC